MEDKFIFRDGPVHGRVYNFVNLRFTFDFPPGIPAPEISQRIRHILEPIGLLQNTVIISGNEINTVSIITGEPVEEMKFPLSQIVEDKKTATVSYRFQVTYLSPESQNNNGEETPAPGTRISSEMLLLFAAILFG